MERERAIEILRKKYDPSGCDETLRKALETLIPELKESEDERIRKELIEALKTSKTVGELKFRLPAPTREECIAYLEKQKDVSKAIEAVERIDKYIDERLANAHDMKDSNPDKKYYRGWDDALGKMAGILQDVYSGEKKKESLRDFIDDFPYSDQKEQKPVDLSEMMVHKEPYIAPVPTPMVADEQRPAEWSESDTIMCNAALALLRSHPNLMASNGINKSSIIRWLQSFRPQRQGFVDDICSKAGISIPYVDGNQWCILKGDNIQSGVVGFGDTKEDALANFIKDVPIQQSGSEKRIADIFEKVGLAKIAREQGNDELTNAIQDAMLELSKLM